MNNQSFISSVISSNLLFDYSNNVFSTNLFGWDTLTRFNSQSSTYFGYVFDGISCLETVNGDFKIKKGMYFSIPGPFQIDGGRGIVIEIRNYSGVFNIGGPIEKYGRLKYIDGCTDSLLLPPLKFGEPCLNALFFPGNVHQTQHTHPSFRMGIVAKGKGVCITPNRKYELKAGDVFVIPSENLHSFKTSNKTNMIVIAYHPDSDYGPKDDEHPMINRTIVQGKSAKEITNILTQ